MRWMMWPLRQGMLKMLENTRDLFWHRQVNIPFWVIPLQFHATKLLSIPIDSYIYVLLFKMLSKWWACFSPTYLMLKSSTTNVNAMGYLQCVQRPGVYQQGAYTCGFRTLMSCCWSRIPAWGKPYMPLLISIYTLLLCMMLDNLYCWMMSLGRKLNGNTIYSLLWIGVPR